MKKNKFILFGLAVTLMFTSCLKDKKVDDQVYGTNNLTNGVHIVELPYQASKLHAIGLDGSPAIEVINAVEVNLPNGKIADEDVTVQLVKNMTLVSDWNLANGTNYIDMPANVYSIVSPGGLTVTIPKGSNRGFVQFKIDKNNVDYNAAYGIGYSISTVTSGYTISQNFKNVIINIGVKNKYDGSYGLRCRMSDWSTPYGIGNFTWDWPGDVHLITVGPASVKLFDDWGFGTYIHPARTTANGLTGFGQTELKLTFNPANDNLSAAVNDINATNGRTFAVNPAVTDSRWTAAKIYSSVLLQQPGRPNLQIFDTLTYHGPR